MSAAVSSSPAPPQLPSMFSPVPVSSFHSHVERLSRPVPSCGGADGFDVELDALYSLQSSPSALAAVYTPTAAEQHKNRYCDVLPNSASRVRLLHFPGCLSSDYLNASLVSPTLFSFPAYPYIAAQAPLASCVADFWYMLWEQRSELVVMLTKERERGRDKDETVIRKADRYWPPSNSHTLTLGAMSVALSHATTLSAEQVEHIQRAAAADGASSASVTTLLSSLQQSSGPSSSPAPPASAAAFSSSTSSSDPVDASSALSACPIVVREFVVSCGSEQRTVRQLQYIGWPDHGVPSDLASFASLFQLYRLLRAATPRTAPVVVHCSAGIGRTGTFCTIDLALDQIAHHNHHNNNHEDNHAASSDTTDTGAGTAGLTGQPPLPPPPPPPSPPTVSPAPATAAAAPPPAAGAGVSVANLVRLLRVSRGGMVQTKGQYHFCYRFLDYCIHAPPHSTLAQLTHPLVGVADSAQFGQNGHISGYRDH